MKKFPFQSFVLILIAFILGFSEFIIVDILNDLSREFSVSVSTVGYLVTIFALIYACSTPVITSLIGQRPLKKVLLILLGIFTVGNLLTALAPTYLILSISRIVVAIVSGAAISVAMAFGTHLAPLEKRAWLISWVYSGFSVASVFGVPLGTWLSHKFGWPMAFFTIFVISIVAMLFVWLSLPADFKQVRSEHNRFSDQFTIFKHPQIQLSVLITMFSLAAVYVVYTYLRPLFSEQLHISISLITITFTVYGFMSLLSNQLSGKIAEGPGLSFMPKVYLCQLALLIALPFLLTIPILGTIDIMLLGLTVYLINSPIQLHVLEIAEASFPQSLVLASSLNSIFANFGIALGSAA